MHYFFIACSLLANRVSLFPDTFPLLYIISEGILPGIFIFIIYIFIP